MQPRSERRGLLCTQRLLLHAARQLVIAQAGAEANLRIDITITGEIPLHVYFDSPAALPSEQVPQLADPEDLALLAWLAGVVLTPLEWSIVDELERGALQGQQVANRLQMTLANLRVLAELVNRGVLNNDSKEGYSIARPDMIGLLKVRKSDSNSTPSL